VTAPAPPGLVRPDTDPLPDPVALDGGLGQVRRAVTYAAPPGFRPLELDLHTPTGDPAPLIVFVHGGGWRVGTRAVFNPIWRDWAPDPFHRLVAAGFAVASVDYRLSGEATFPAQLHDVTAALRFLHRRADELGVDARRVVAWGESAGGHLAALLGLTAGRPELADLVGEPAPPVAGVVDWYGPADLETLPAQARPDAIARADAPDSRESLLIGAPLLEARDLARRASPVTYVHGAAPPFHLAHGADDRFVPAGQSRELADALRAAGIRAQLTIVPGADHMWRDAADPERIFTAAVDFSRRVLDGEEAGSPERPGVNNSSL
jgi:acetyl esterase/lipase